jgi:hypothetical protein
MYLCTLLSVLWSTASRIVTSLGESLNVGSFGFITLGESNWDMGGARCRQLPLGQKLLDPKGGK